MASCTVARVESMLRRSQVLASLGPEAVREAAQAASLRRFARGECIWRVGERAVCFQVLVSGIVKLVAPGPGLRPTILDVFGPGEALGHWAAFDDSAYIGDAIPLTERVETLLVPASVLHQAMRARPESALAMTHAVLAYARALRAKIAVMCAGSVHHRLAMLLLDLDARFGDELEDGGAHRAGAAVAARPVAVRGRDHRDRDPCDVSLAEGGAARDAPVGLRAARRAVAVGAARGRDDAPRRGRAGAPVLAG